MKHIRIKSFGLALMMVLASFPMSATTGFAAPAATVTTPQLSFVDGEDPKSSYVITGRPIYVNEVVPSGYVSAGLDLTRAKIDGDSSSTEIPVTPSLNRVTISERTNGRRSILFIDKFNPMDPNGALLEPDQPGRAVYVVNGRYYATLMTGEVIQTDAVGNSNSGTATFRTNAAITEYSRMTIVSDGKETSSGPPMFHIDFTNSPPEGAFTRFTGTAAAPGRVSASRDPKNAQKLILTISYLNETITVEVDTRLSYSNETDEEGNLVDANGDVIKDPATQKPVPLPKPNNYIHKNTTFELIYRMPTVEPLLLTVMTPQSAIQELEQQVRDSDGETDKGTFNEDSAFIKLAKGDSLDYITDNFDLRHLSTQFGADFRVEWKWEPTHIWNATKEEFEEIPTDQKTAATEAVKLGGSNTDWQTATINPLEDDLKGNLTATVYYKKDGNTQQKTNSDKIDGQSIPVKDITIKGTGKPVKVTAVSQTFGVKNSASGQKVPLNDLLAPNVTHVVNMDAYRGGISVWNNAANPYQYEIKMDLGEKNGAAKHAIVTVVGGDADAVFLQSSEGTGGYMNYSPGAQIKNTTFGLNGNTTAGKAGLLITAQQLPPDAEPKTVTLNIKFYLQGRNNALVESPDSYTIRFNITDSTPSQDSSLKSLMLRDQDGQEIIFPFDPKVLSYTGNAGTIHIPYKSNTLTFTPTLNDPRGGDNPIEFKFIDTLKKPVATPGPLDSGDHYNVMNGQRSRNIPFYPTGSDPNSTDMVGKVYSLIITVPSQDPRRDFWTTYQLDIVRDPPSDDNTMSSLEVYLPDADSTKPENNLIKSFKPEETEYTILIPYSTKSLRIRATKNHERADGPNLVSPDGYQLESLNGIDPPFEWLKDLKKKFQELGTGEMRLQFDVTSEAGTVTHAAGTTRSYFLNIRREDPNDDPSLKGLIVTDPDDNEQTYRPNFKPDTDTYTMDIPYSVKEIKLNIDPNDPNVENIQVYHGSQEPGKIVLDMLNGREKGTVKEGDPLTFRPGALSPKLPVLDLRYVVDKGGYDEFIIVVTAEDGNAKQTYYLRVQRAEPSTDAKLKSLILKDQNNADIKTFAFHPDETEYDITVPFNTSGVSFTPTTNHPYATIKIIEEGLLGGIIGSLIPYEIESGVTSKVFKLKDPREDNPKKKFQIIVTPEDGIQEHAITYTIYITREMPSSDARLKALKTDNTENFKPLFIANKLDYTADVKEGAPGVIITPTANHPGATIKVDGVVVQSGSPTDLIELLEIKQKVRIEVTAEDGVTKMVYTIEFTNQNLIEKTSNADLKRLTVNYGLITPTFKSSVTEYEVTVTEKTWSVDVIPKPADPLATMRVLNGTREIGDYNGNYGLALADGENNLTIEVTSPDKTVKKNYDIVVYRNEEEKLKNLEPLEAEDVDFEKSGNPIIVKIEEYPRIGASVFNTLREDYPEKTIIFQGNDYSLRFDAKNLSRVIPQETIYDFRMEFESPDEDAIYDLISEREANDDIIDDVVMMYFYYHGSLPGPATFNLSLGRRYANDTLYWHYYNQDRDRIDYYGSLKSNSKGTVAVSMDHFSTYIVSPEHRIAGSEDKAGIIDEMGMVSNGQDLLGSGGKLNPDTGAGREEP